MTDPFKVKEQAPRIMYSECQFAFEEKQGQYGPYHELTFNLFPVDGDNHQAAMRKYFASDRRNVPWDTDVLPSILELVNKGQIKQAPDLNGAFVAWHWQTYRSYKRNDVSYFETNNPDKVLTDENGKQYVEKACIVFDEIFPNEDKCREVCVENRPDSGGSGESEEITDEVRQYLDQVPEILKFNGSLVNGKVSSDKVTELLESTPALEHLNAFDEVVVNVVKKVDPTYNDIPF